MPADVPPHHPTPDTQYPVLGLPARLEHGDTLVRTGIPGQLAARAVEVHLVPDADPGRLVPEDPVHLVDVLLKLLLVQLDLQLVEEGVVLLVLPVREVEL